MTEIIPEPIKKNKTKIDNRLFYLVAVLGAIIVLTLGTLTWRIYKLEQTEAKNRKTITGQELPSLIDAALQNEGARNLILQKINGLIQNGTIKLGEPVNPFTVGTPETPVEPTPEQPINP